MLFIEQDPRGALQEADAVGLGLVSRCTSRPTGDREAQQSRKGSGELGEGRSRGSQQVGTGACVDCGALLSLCRNTRAPHS